MAAVLKLTPEFAGEADVYAAYEGMVRRLAFKLSRHLPETVSLEDLLQAGSIALIEAYRRYDGSSGASFETYASIRINGAMVDELRRTAFGSRGVRRELRRMADVIDLLSNRVGREPRNAEVAKEMGLEINQYYSLMARSLQQQVLSLDVPGPDSDGSVGDAIENECLSPESEAECLEINQRVRTAIEQLPERERLALSLYYFHGMNLREVGLRMGLSESRVCQLQSGATRKLRASLIEFKAA